MTNLFDRFISISIIGFIAVFLLDLPAQAQSLEELKRLPKEELIKMAVQKTGDSAFHFHRFTMIRVWANKNDIDVEFGHLVEYQPRKKNYWYSVTVPLIQGTATKRISGKSVRKLSPSEIERVPLYDPSDYEIELRFILKNINNSEVKGIDKSSDISSNNSKMIISEELNYYKVIIESKLTHTGFRLKKGTGKVSKLKVSEVRPIDNRKRLY
jgi:hypothetical protein